jgi:hypothetical protein
MAFRLHTGDGFGSKRHKLELLLYREQFHVSVACWQVLRRGL